MLLHGIPAQSLESEVQQLQMVASIISHGHNQKIAAIKAPDSEHFLLSFEANKLIKSPSLPNLMGESEPCQLCFGLQHTGSTVILQSCLPVPDVVL